MQELGREAPDLRLELVEAEPEESLPMLALGDVDVVLADEWQHQPLARPVGVDREDLWRDPVQVVLPETHAAARRYRRAVPLSVLAHARWTTGHPRTAWERMTTHACRELGGFDPDVRHRTNDSVTSLALVERARPSRLCRAARRSGSREASGRRRAAIADGALYRTIFTATRPPTPSGRRSERYGGDPHGCRASRAAMSSAPGNGLRGGDVHR